MMIELIYWVALAVATYTAFIYFRDLGDVTQAIMDVSRKNMLNAIRNENKLVACITEKHAERHTQ